MFRLREERAVHVRVPARLEHQCRAQVIAVGPHPFAPLEHRRALDARKAVHDESEWFAGGVCVDGAEGGHSRCSQFAARGSRSRSAQSKTSNASPTPSREPRAASREPRDRAYNLPAPSRYASPIRIRRSPAAVHGRSHPDHGIGPGGVFVRPRAATPADGARGRPEPRVLWRDAGVHAGKWCARHEARHRVRQQCRRGAAHAPGDDPADGLRPQESCCRSWTDGTSPKRGRPRSPRSRSGCWRARTPGCWRFSGRECRREAI